MNPDQTAPCVRTVFNIVYKISGISFVVDGRERVTF